MENNKYKYLVDCNVIDEDEYKYRVKIIFDAVCQKLSSTYGPYGSHTIFEKEGKINVTKDGWLSINDYKFSNPMANTILDIIRKICYNVVDRVGDGTTTSVVSADKLFDVIDSNPVLKKMRPKELSNLFEQVREQIMVKIVELSTKVTDENRADVIRRIASISSNNDKKITDMMVDIYSKVPNPVISYKETTAFETTYDIVEGYKIPCKLMNEYDYTSSQKMEVKNPLIMVFDHTINEDSYTRIVKPVKAALIDESLADNFKSYRPLVIFAKDFDKIFLQNRMYEIQKDINMGMPLITKFVKCYATSNNENQQLNDFCAFLGSELIRGETINRLHKCSGVKFELDKVGDREWLNQQPDFAVLTDDQYVENLVDGKEMVGDEYTFNVNFFVGTCGKLVVNDARGNENAIISEYTNKNQAKIDLLIKDAESKLKEVTKEGEFKMILHTDIPNIQARISMLNGFLISINIGGESDMARRFEQSVIDDVVKACKCACKYGYNIGGSLIIPIAIESIKKLMVMPAEPTKQQARAIEREIALLDCISKAFKETFKVVLKRKYRDRDDVIEALENIDEGVIDASFINQNMTDELYVDELCNRIIDNCVKEKTCYDLVIDKFSDSIINPSYTDIEIVKATLHMLSLLITANQYVTIAIDRDALSKKVDN